MASPDLGFPKGQPKPKVAGKKAKKPNKTALLKKADTLFSKLVRSPGICAGRCEGNPKGHLQCAHGFSRRYRAVRWDFRNAFPLCAGCHKYWTERPLEWDEWMRGRMGEGLYEELRVLALTGPNPDLHQTVLRLESLLRESDAA